MKELQYLEIISKTLDDSSLLGNDCAFLQDFNLFITQDTLAEGVHFNLNTTTPYQLGQKAVNVNLSDLAAALAKPLYITVSLSLPSGIDSNFIQDFYKGINKSCEQYGITVAGGDLTGAEKKLVISICAIGKKVFDIDVSRHFSKPGDVIVTTGSHGDSAAGLKLLTQDVYKPEYLINRHLIPYPRLLQSTILAQILQKYDIKQLSIMDTSDGLGDAVFKLSKCSGFEFEIDYDSLPVSDDIKRLFPFEYKDMALWGGEDFELLFTVPEKIYNKLDKDKFIRIGNVSDKPFSETNKIYLEYKDKVFKHFEEA